MLQEVQISWYPQKKLQHDLWRGWLVCSFNPYPLVKGVSTIRFSRNYPFQVDYIYWSNGSSFYRSIRKRTHAIHGLINWWTSWQRTCTLMNVCASIVQWRCYRFSSYQFLGVTNQRFSGKKIFILSWALHEYPELLWANHPSFSIVVVFSATAGLKDVCKIVVVLFSATAGLKEVCKILSSL